MMTKGRRAKIILFTIPLLLVLAGIIGFKQETASAFNAGNIIDDAVFYNPRSMSVSQIQAFLNARVPVCDTNGTKSYAGTTRAAYGTSRGYPPPYTCLKNYSMDTTGKPVDSLCNGHSAGRKSAARIIYEVAHSCSVNPKVLIVLLQKEQALVTDDWPWSIQYQRATGYGCPDSAPCDSQYYGFFNQVYEAARAYKRYRANPGNYNYRAGRHNNILFHPNAACGSSGVNIRNQATAGLYIYTPYQPNQALLSGSPNGCSSYGNYNFWTLYRRWFGSTYGFGPCIDGSNVGGALKGKDIIGVNSTLMFRQFNHTGSGCTELHVWNPNLKTWQENVASNIVSQNPAHKQIIATDINGDGRDELALIKQQSGSGKVEIHAWDDTQQRWYLQRATGLGNIPAGTGEIISADIFGDGRDELIYVKYNGTGSGMIELHVFNPGYRSWQNQYVTNVPEINMFNGRVIAGNLRAGPKDEITFVKYNDTGSNRLELHTWKPGYKQWLAQFATNVPPSNPQVRKVLMGKAAGSGTYEEIMYMIPLGTGSGRTEVHVWNWGFKSWRMNVATGLGLYDPRQ